MKYLVITLTLVHVLILTQLQFEVWPEMLVMPFLQQNGFELYRDMVVPWTPGLMWLLHGWFHVVGLTVSNLKLATWGLVAGIDVLIYLIAKNQWGKLAGLVSLVSFIFLQPIFDGNGLWFDLAVVPLLLLAFHRQYPALLGPAFLIKQSVVWLIPVIITSKGQVMLKFKHLILGLGGAIGVSMVWFWTRGTLGDYWRWAYEFAFLKLPQMPGHADYASWRHWVFALAPFGVVGVAASLKGSKHWGRFFSCACPLFWATWAILFAFPRFGLFHFQPAVAFLALEVGHLASYFLPAGRRSRDKSVALLTLSTLMVAFIIIAWTRLLGGSWQKADRFLEPNVYQYAATIALESSKDDPVLLVNGPELAYVLADRLPPKPWLTQFSWFLELPGFQEDLILKFEQQRVYQVFLTPYQSEGTFVPGSYRPQKLLEYVEN